jgi:hypothetical protein
LSDEWTVEDSISMLRVAGQVIYFKLQLIGARVIWFVIRWKEGPMLMARVAVAEHSTGWNNM